MKAKAAKKKIEFRFGFTDPERDGPWLAFGRYPLVVTRSRLRCDCRGYSLHREDDASFEVHFDWLEARAAWARGGFRIGGNLYGFDAGISFPRTNWKMRPVLDFLEEFTVDAPPCRGCGKGVDDDGSADATPPAE